MKMILIFPLLKLMVKLDKGKYCEIKANINPSSLLIFITHNEFIIHYYSTIIHFW